MENRRRQDAKMEPGYRLAGDIPYYEEGWEKRGDTAYLEERCKLDVYYPENADEAAAVVFFHGGGLSTGEKGIPERLKNAGLIIVAPNYRLSPDRARCPDYLYDAAAAAAWTFRHIGEFGGSSELVFVSGSSGGAYLAMMIGMDPRYLACFGESHRRFAALLPVTGQMTTHFQILNERNGTGGMLQPLRPVIDEYAPLYHASADLPPIELYAGDPKIEWPGRAEENLLLAAQLTRVAGHTDTTVHILSGFEHCDVGEPACVLMRKRITAETARRLRPKCKPLPLNVGETPVRTPFLTRRGKADSPGTVAEWRYAAGTLTITVDLPESRMEALTEGGQCWDGDCVELYFADASGKVCQWVLTPEGRTARFIDAGARAPKVETKTVRRADGWQAVFRLRGEELPPHPRANLIRRRQTGGEPEYSNWSPCLTDVNRELEAMVELELA